MRVQSPAPRVECQNPWFGLRARAGSRRLTLDSRLSRRGLTLIELLVVIIILTTLVSAAIPIMAPTNDDRRLREASRGANAFISAAQMKAIQIQRPFGVAIKRLSKDTNTNITPTTDDHEDNAVAVELFYVEQPAPYRGFDRTSSAMVARHPTLAGRVLIQFATRGTGDPNDGLPIGWDLDLFPPGVIRPGDVIEIDGTQYQLSGGTPSVQANVTYDANGFFTSTGSVTRIDAQPINDTGQMLNIEFDDQGARIRDLVAIGLTPAGPNRPYWTNPAPYKILRQPMPTSAEPFQMPEGTAIDLRASGIGQNEYFHYPNVRDNSQGILIMFTPEGRVARVSFSTLPTGDALEGSVEVFDQAVTDNIFLLVGRRENAPPPAATTDPTTDPILPQTTEQQRQEMKEAINWLRGESRWIVIGSQSGRVVTTENAFVNLPPTLVSSDKEERRNAQIQASREFAREMTQVGGR
jgi:prepilin-type N-terminal cleavage/methylation domain-containing protein